MQALLVLYPEFHSQIISSAFSWKRFHVQGPMPGAALLPWLRALLMSGCPVTTVPREGMSGSWLCPAAPGFGSWKILFLWICLPFLQPCVVALGLVWLHFLHWSWFPLEQVCSQTPAGRFIASGKQADIQGSSHQVEQVIF